MTRPTGIFKKENEYQKMLSPKMYETTPKAVFAGLVVSYLLNHMGIDAKDLESDIEKEWDLLYQQGIIPQKPY